MAKIEDLQNLDFDKIGSEPLQKAVKNLLADYEKEDDKDFFKETAKGNIDKLFSMVQTHSPEAIKKAERKPAEKKETDKPAEVSEDKPATDKEKSKKILEELKELDPELEACRAVIREYNKQKREAEGEKPKKTRYTKLKEKLLALVSLIPDKLKDDVDVQRKTEKVLLSAHRELVDAWGMNKVKAKSGAEAIKDKFEAMEEKAEKKTEIKKS